MSAAPTSQHATARECVAARHPVQVDLDGDFVLEDLLALPQVGPAHRLTTVPATLAALGRRHPDDHAEPTATAQPGTVTTLTEADAVLLHRIETSSLFRPPVRERVAALTPEVGAAWLALAARWIDLSQCSDDLRMFNTACKLTGAIWLHRRADATWREPSLTGQVAAVARLLGEATHQLRNRLANRIVLAEPAVPGEQALCLGRLAGASQARIAVLASAGSRSAGRLVTAAITARLPIQTVCWYAPPRTGSSQSSNYASAWYPPAPPAATSSLSVPSSVSTATAGSWDEVTAVIRAADADVVLLVGMPVVPGLVLRAARLVVLNAHNGALPTHRGMDAVGWALLNNQPVVCSLHLARPVVDTGEVLAAHPVPIAPVDTLAARVKLIQLRLLLAGAAHIAATGALPDLTPQPAAGTQFYRLHAHLKRLLDASPYAHSDGPEWTVIQP